MMSDSRPKVLVLGATGSIGRALVENLVADPGPEKVQVVAAVRDAAKAEPFHQMGVETVHLDLNRAETVPGSLESVDRVFLLTGYSVEMLAQSKAVVDAAKKAGVRHVVHLGAHATDDTTIVHLGWHQFVERYVEWSGLGFTHLRPNIFMQNLLGYAGVRWVEGGTITQFIGDAPVSWIDTDDIALVAAAVLREPGKHAGKTYPLAVEALNNHQVAEVLAEVIGRPFRYEPKSPDQFLETALRAGMEPAYAGCIRDVYAQTGDRSLTEAADVFDNFTPLTGRKPTLWREFAEKHRTRFDY